MRKSLMILVAMAPALLAQGGANCRQVGGAILTNFVDQTTTLGTATGDLKGGLGVTVLSLAPGANGTLVFHVHHHWVTEAGDTITLNDTYATAYPSGIPGLSAVSYTNGVTIAGGTGRFAGATGKLTSYGAIDLNNQHLILRYEGQVCYPPVEP